MPGRVRAGERGQALLVVLVFLAAFLLITWAGLSLASGAFLGLNTVRTDARTNYALDAGLAYAMYAIDTKNGNGCNVPKTTAVTLSYPGGPITLNVGITKGNPCKGNGATWNVTVTASGTNRTLTALVTEQNLQPLVTWESIQ